MTALQTIDKVINPDSVEVQHDSTDFIKSHSYRFLPKSFEYYAHRVDNYVLKGNWVLTKLIYTTHPEDSYAFIIHANGTGPDMWYVSKPGCDLRKMTHELWNDVDDMATFNVLIAKYFR